MGHQRHRAAIAHRPCDRDDRNDRDLDPDLVQEYVRVSCCGLDQSMLVVSRRVHQALTVGRGSLQGKAILPSTVLHELCRYKLVSEAIGTHVGTVARTVQLAMQVRTH